MYHSPSNSNIRRQLLSCSTCPPVIAQWSARAREAATSPTEARPPEHLLPSLRELAQCVSRLRSCDFFLSFFKIRNSEVNLLPKIINSGIKYIEGT